MNASYRLAIALTLGVADKVGRHDEEVPWYTAKRFRKPEPAGE